MKKFFFQAGNSYTNKAWKMPNKKRVEDLVDDIQYLCPYDMYLVGGVLNDKMGKTWDVDIVINGEIEIKKFEETLYNIYDTALNNHNILVDVRWYDKPVERLQYIIDNNITETWKSIRYGYFLKKVDNYTTEIDLFKEDKAIRLTEFLVQREFTNPQCKSLGIKNKYLKINAEAQGFEPQLQFPVI